MAADQFKITFHSLGRGGPTQAPNPMFPNGRDVDTTDAGQVGCKADLPYPFPPELGVVIVACTRCDLRIAITIAGRPDDVRSVKLPCKWQFAPAQGSA